MVKNNEALKFTRASCLTRKRGNQMTTHEDNKNNQNQKSQDPLQFALTQAAKVGNINLIRECCEMSRK